MNLRKSIMNSAKIVVDGNERAVDVTALEALANKYMPSFTVEQKESFINEVLFRMSNLEETTEFCGGMSIEEYRFAACMAYAQDNGLEKFFQEMDDGAIWEYCGTTLEDLNAALQEA